MAFLNSTVSVACTVEPGSCQAQRDLALWSRSDHRVPVTDEWLERNEAKQKAYEAKRREWRKQVGIVDTNF
jgi:hypothetical protein